MDFPKLFKIIERAEVNFSNDRIRAVLPLRLFFNTEQQPSGFKDERQLLLELERWTVVWHPGPGAHAVFPVCCHNLLRAMVLPGSTIGPAGNRIRNVTCRFIQRNSS